VSAGGFRLDPDELAVLAAATDDLAEAARTAAGRAQPITPDAYGYVGAGFGTLAYLASMDGAGAIDELAAATARAAATLRAELAGYAEAERSATAAFDGLAR